MRRLILIAAICVFALGVSAQTADKYNLDFETADGATGWPATWYMGTVRDTKIPMADSVRLAYRLDSNTKYSGKYSLLIDWTKQSQDWTPVTNAVKQVFYGRKIKLTGYLKTENVTGTGAGLWLRLDGADNENQGFDNMMKRAVKGTTDWKEYTIELDYNPDKVLRIYFGGLIVGTGKLWLDNLKIEIDGKDISEARTYTPATSQYAADNDTAFKNGITVRSIALDGDKIKNLTNLGMLWGFMKYYHAGVGKGAYNMDAALFRVLPKILAAKSTGEANADMEYWVDGFGKPAVCKKCAEPDDPAQIKLRPDYGDLFNKNNLPKSLTDKLEYIKQNRLNERSQYYIAPNEGTANPVFLHERSYQQNVYPDAGLRLLALYRYWNMVQYFFPDRHLIGEDWNKVLGEFIPVFCNAADTLEYQTACLKLIARIHDTHANIWGGAAELSRMKGRLIIPLEAEFIENKLVVTDFYKNTGAAKEKIKKGDVIEQIDGVPVEGLIKKYLEVTPASNYETQLRDLPGQYGFLLRGNKPEAILAIRRGSNTMDVTLQRIEVEAARKQNDEHAGFKMLPGNIGYLYPAALTDTDLDTVKTLFENTSGLVIDMRCYPSTFMPFTYGAWLKPNASDFVKFTMPDVSYPGYFKLEKGQKNGRKNKNYYKGKTVIIVNATTQSQAEYTTMALSTVPGATVIGSTTAGADGDISSIVLPGGIRTIFSGLGILYPDGTETQRKGVRIDKVVQPTIKGVTDGKDELLDEAVKIIKG